MTFDFAEGLAEDNLLIVDRETRSLWSQLDARAISGPRKGEPLRVVPALQTSWGHWRSLHPETSVMTVEGDAGRPYYYRAWIPGSPRPEERRPFRAHRRDRSRSAASAARRATRSPYGRRRSTNQPAMYVDSDDDRHLH